MTSFYQGREDYVSHIVPLMIWHLWDLNRRGACAMPFDLALNRYVDIYRLTILSKSNLNPAAHDIKDPAWDELRQRIAVIFEHHANSSDSVELEAECMHLLWPLMEPRIARDSVLIPASASPYGCWWYDVRGDHFAIHIRNAVSPASPFDNMTVLAADLLRMLRDARALNPAVDIVRCTSWLHNIPVFLTLFPPSWLNSQDKVLETGSGLGIWGQYMNRRGAFHYKNAKQFRETGQHPYFCISCHCPCTELIAHLQNFNTGHLHL